MFNKKLKNKITELENEVENMKIRLCNADSKLWDIEYPDGYVYYAYKKFSGGGYSNIIVLKLSYNSEPIHICTNKSIDNSLTLNIKKIERDKYFISDKSIDLYYLIQNNIIIKVDKDMKVDFCSNML